MFNDLKQAINRISSKDRSWGMLLHEVIECAENGKSMAATAALFVMLEQAVRYASDFSEDKLVVLIEELAKKKIISEREKVFLNDARQKRNLLFHVNSHSLYIDLDGISYPLDEPSSWARVFESYAPASLQLIDKLV